MIGAYGIQRAFGAVKIRRFSLLVWAMLLLVSFVVLMELMRHGQKLQDDYTKLFFDVALPYTSGLGFALLWLWRSETSFKRLDKKLQSSVKLMSWGAFLFFVGDLGFSVSTTVPADKWYHYFNGDWIDFFYLTAFYLWGRAIIQFPLEATGPMMKVSDVLDWLLAQCDKMVGWLEFRPILKTLKNKAPKINIFFQGFHPVIRLTKLFIQFMMLINFLH